VNSDISQLFKKHGSELSYQMPRPLKNQILGELFPEPKVSFLSWMFVGGGAIATLASLVLAFQLGKMSGPSDQIVTEEVVSAHFRSLMGEHLYDVVSTDQHTVKPWFEGKIDFSPVVKDFAKEGFPLVGGRLDYIDGRPTAALVYRFNKHIINVFQHPTTVPESAAPRLKTLRGIQVFTWTKEGMSYQAVTDVNAADLQKFVTLWQ
jgi:anti-sigma factor RsiW